MNSDNQSIIMKKQAALHIMQTAPELYILVSSHTRLPFVICDDETLDDEIYLYASLEAAQKEEKRLVDGNNLASVVKLEQKQFLGFYNMLYTLGVNSVFFEKGLERQVRLQLSEIVKRPQADKLPDSVVRVENPALHLTALYFMQKAKALKKGEEMTEELMELQEEMLTHFHEGKYIIAVDEKQGLPILQQPNGDVFQPLFTDFPEFIKFKRNNKFQTSVVEASAIANILKPEVKGVVINPFGVNVQLQIARK